MDEHKLLEFKNKVKEWNKDDQNEPSRLYEKIKSCRLQALFETTSLLNSIHIKPQWQLNGTGACFYKPIQQFITGSDHMSKASYLKMQTETK